jgi:hypothetical protein
MVLYALYVCFMYSHFIENPSIDLEAANPSFLRWFCHQGGGHFCFHVMITTELSTMLGEFLSSTLTHIIFRKISF